jgi:hypothetical protein
VRKVRGSCYVGDTAPSFRPALAATLESEYVFQLDPAVAAPGQEFGRDVAAFKQPGYEGPRQSAEQARYPESILCRFLDRCLPQRALVVEEWARRAASGLWAGIYLPDAESRQRIGVAAEIRIGLDLGESPACGELLSFLPAAEYSALLSAAGFSPDENKMAEGGTASALISAPRCRRTSTNLSRCA